MNMNLCFHEALKDDSLSYFYEDYKNNLSTICRFVDLALDKNLQLGSFLLKVNLMGYLPEHITRYPTYRVPI